MKLSNIIVKWIDPNKIVINSANPQSRIDRDNPAFRKLKKAVRLNGNVIVYPVLVDKRMQLVDGHRRHAVATDLKIQIPYLQCDSKSQADFLMIQNNSSGLSSYNYLEMYLNKGVVTEASGKSILLLEKYGGKEVLRKIMKMKKSPYTYTVALRMFFKVMPEYTDAIAKKCLKHIIKYGAFDFKQAIRYGISKSEIIDHINDMIPFSFTVE